MIVRSLFFHDTISMKETLQGAIRQDMKIQYYTRKRKLKADEKLGTQAKTIYDALPDSGEILRKDLVDRIAKDLVTKQDPDRVFAFYRPKLLSTGLITERTETVEKEKPPKAEKPAKAPKAKATGKGKGAKGARKEAA